MSEPNVWVLDIETYYKDTKGDTDKYSLRHMSTTEYIRDERWKLHGLAVLDPSGQASFEPESAVAGILAEIKPEDVVVAHNWAFDGLALAHHYGFKHWRVTDTLLLANAVLGPAADRGSGNSLGALAEELGFESKGRLDPMEDVRDLSPDQWDYLALYAKGDVRLSRQIYDALLPRLSRAGLELWIMRHSLNIFINRPIRVSSDRLQAAVKDCRAWKQSKLDRVMKPQSIKGIVTRTTYDGTTEEVKGESRFKATRTLPPLVEKEIQLSSQKQFVGILEPLLTKHKLKMPMKKSNPRKDGTTEMIPALAKTDEGFKALAACGVKPIEHLIEARLVQRSAATVMARLKKIEGVDKAHMSLTYHGTCTGRWSGGGNGWNPQNIPAPHRASSEEEAVMARAIRSCLIPRRGHVFVSVDAANIEARVLAWMAGQWDVVQAFGDGVDLYSQFISDVLGETVIKGHSDRDDALRSVGKEAILGLGYGMGWFKFLRRLREHPQAAIIREALGRKLAPPFVKELVATYRDTYEHIPELWVDLEEAFHRARRGHWASCGPIEFHKGPKSNSVHAEFPCGRRILYSDLRRIDGTYGNSQWVYGRGKKVYGGLLTENMVQGTSRDVLAEGIWSVEKMGWPVVLTVHDSVICQVLEKDAEQCLADCIGTLSQTPVWGEGMMLDAEGHIAEDFN